MKTRQAHRAALLAITGILSGFMLSACGNNTADKEKTAEAEAETVYAVTSTVAVKGELQDYLEFGGDVSAKTNIDVLPDTSGKISEVRVKIGDIVEKNEVIAYVDPSRPGMNYEPSPVKAPISGTVTTVNVTAGNMVSPQIAVARISKTESLQIGMNVPERYVSKIKQNQKAYLRFDAYPGEIFPARISEISPVLDQTSRTMAVKLVLVNEDPRIKAGMFARIKLITDTRTDTVKIQEAAVITRFDETFVFVVQNGEKTTVSKVMVKPGIKVDDKIEILAGLKAGDEIVIKGQTLLEDGSAVNVISKAESLESTEKK